MPGPPQENARAYVTVLSTDDYLAGVRVLDLSLRLHRSAHPLYVVVGDNVSAEVRESLRRARMHVLDAPRLDIPTGIISANQASDHHRHWAGVFEKLVVFSLVQFEKLVYLDSDMLVLRNIDELFEQPDMAAVVADVRAGTVESRDLNAGLMVIEPRPGLTTELVETLPAVFESEKRWRQAAGRPVSMGVQSVINSFWSDWYDEKELHLHPKYNVLVPYLDNYVRERGFRWTGPDGIRVLHFIGQRKPWMFRPPGLLAHAAKLLARRRVGEAVAHVLFGAAWMCARLPRR